MTNQEITDYVMALSHADLDRELAEKVMGWESGAAYGDPWWTSESKNATRGYLLHYQVNRWKPTYDRNQSRQVTDKTLGWFLLIEELGDAGPLWWDLSPLQECQYALIAYYIHKQETNSGKA